MSNSAISFRIPAKTKKRLRNAAAEHGLSESDVIRRAIRYVTRREDLQCITKRRTRGGEHWHSARLPAQLRESVRGYSLPRIIDAYLDAQPPAPPRFESAELDVKLQIIRNAAARLELRGAVMLAAIEERTR